MTPIGGLRFILRYSKNDAELFAFGDGQKNLPIVTFMKFEDQDCSWTRLEVSKNDIGCIYTVDGVQSIRWVRLVKHT